MQENAHVPSSPPLATGRKLTPYVAVWSGLAVVALAYITIAVVNPDMLAGSATPQTSLSETLGQRDQHTERSAEEKRLAEKLAVMEQELEQGQTADVEQPTNQQSHLDRIAALEAKAARAETAESGSAAQKQEQDASSSATESANVTDSLTAQPVNPATKQAADEIADRLGGATILNDPDAAKNTTTIAKQTAQPQTKNNVSAETKVETAKAAPVKKVTTVAKAPAKTAEAKPPAPKPAPKKQTAALPKPKPAVKAAPKKVAKAPLPPIKTGSVGKSANTPISFGPAVVTRATRPIGVRLATGPSLDSLRLSWTALADRHGPTVRTLQPRYVTGIDATGLTYDLIAGPFNTAAEATAVCARLHANGVRCALGEFTGNALN